MHIAKKGFDNAPPLPYNKNNIEHRKGTSPFRTLSTEVLQL